MLKTSVICFLASYGCAFACELNQLRQRHALNRIMALLFGAAGLLAHTFYLLQHSRQTVLPPLLSSAHDWLLVLAWIVVLTYLFVFLADRELATGLGALATGILIWPIVLILVVASRFVTTSPNSLLPYHRGWGMLHASMLVLGTAGVLQGLVLSLLYLWQHRRLKHRQLAEGVMKMPNLELIQRLNRWSILVAVPLLTIGVVTGIGLAMSPGEHSLTMTWSDPVVIGGGVTWISMGILFIWLLVQKRSPGKQIALLTAWSCGFLIVTVLGLQIFVAAMGIRGVH